LLLLISNHGCSSADKLINTFWGLCVGVYGAKNHSGAQKRVGVYDAKNHSGAQKLLNASKIHYLKFCAAQEQ
jgi:hypothetical protein